MAGKKGMKIVRPNEESERHWEYYKKRNPTWPVSQCEAAAKYFRCSCNPRCAAYYETRFPFMSTEEIQEKIYQKNEQRKSNNPLSGLKYWTDHYPKLTKEECIEKWEQYKKENNYMFIEFYIKRHPDLSIEECQKLLDEQMKKTGQKLSDNVKGEKNPNHHSKADYDTRCSRSPFSKKFYEYRGLTEDDWREFTKSIEREYTTSLEYYLNRGMTMDEAIEARRKRQITFSLETCIDKYGEELGTKIFKLRQEKWQKHLQENFEKYGDGRSPQSQWAKECITHICEALNIEVPKKEKFISKNGHTFAYDFKYERKLIEFNGDFWHCWKEWFKPTDIHKVYNKTAQEIWDKDKLKCEVARLANYDILTVWEHEYHENPMSVINRCIDFCNGKEAC